MINLSNWQSVRLWETSVERQLYKSHWLWLHGICIGSLVMAVMWTAAHLQMLAGSESLALRYGATLGIGYFGYLLVLRIWAAMLVKPNSSQSNFQADLPLPGSSTCPHAEGSASELVFQSGGGGNFGGGGASADFSVAANSSEGLGEIANGAFEVAANADEGIVVAVPVLAIFLIGCALLFGVGSLLLLYFGSEALLMVAVELAFAYASARTALSVAREGWLSSAVRLTWKPLMGALFCTVLLGASLDYFFPAAQSLPQAFKMFMVAR